MSVISSDPSLGVPPGEVEVVVCGGGGAGDPPEGISPASADDERTQARTTDTRKRFTGFLLLSWDARFLTSGKNRPASGNSCKC